MGEQRHSMALLRFVVVLCTLAALCNIASSAEKTEAVRERIEGRIRAVGGHPSDMRVHLNGGERVAIVRQDGSFVFQDVPAAAYLLEVISADLTFDQVRISVMRNGNIRATLAADPRVALPHPLFIEPKGLTQYFEVREPMSLGFIFKNPMIMMMGVTMLLVMVLPKMIDPETMKEMQNDESVKAMFGGGASEDKKPDQKSVKGKK